MSSHTRWREIRELIGAIVLSTQDAERYLKAILPFTESQDPSFRAALARHEKLKKRTFGDLVGKFVDASTSDAMDFAEQLVTLVDSRNRIVHHFNETYGEQLRSGNAEQVILSLRTFLLNVDAFRCTLEHMMLLTFWEIGAVSFQGTPEGEAIQDACATFLQRVHANNSDDA